MHCEPKSELDPLSISTAAVPGNFGMRFAEFWAQVVREFLRNRCLIRASALAYTTLLALIPLLALAVSVSTSLLKDDEKRIETWIDQMVGSVAPQLNLEVKTGDLAGEARRKEVVQNIRGYIANTRSGTLGATGALGLVVIAVMLLSTIESTFNDIWGVPKGRAWVTRVVNYWAAITLGPIIVLVAVGLTSGPQFQATQSYLASLPFSLQVLFQLAFRFVPFLILAGAFSMFYAFMPNTRVSFAAAAVGGAVGGVLWQLNNMFNIIYASKVVAYDKIYGSFGVVPMFLAGLYLSWLILLFGAQVAQTFATRASQRTEAAIQPQ